MKILNVGTYVAVALSMMLLGFVFITQPRGTCTLHVFYDQDGVQMIQCKEDA